MTVQSNLNPLPMIEYQCKFLNSLLLTKRIGMSVKRIRAYSNEYRVDTAYNDFVYEYKNQSGLHHGFCLSLSVSGTYLEELVSC